MEAKCYRAMQRAQVKMLREYFSGVPFENLTRRYGYSEKKIKELAADYKQGKIDIFDNPGLDVQRDIFVFQCFIGCRVGDLYKEVKDPNVQSFLQRISEIFHQIAHR